MWEERLRSILNTKMNRRGFINAAATAGFGVGLAATACVMPRNPFVSETIPTATSNSTPVPKKESRYSLSQKERNMLIDYVEDLGDVLKQTINPKFWSEENLGQITRASDEVLAEFFRANASKQGDEVSWYLQLGPVNKASKIDTNITFKYGKFRGEDFVQHTLITASLANSGIPELTPYIDPRTGQFLPDAEKLGAAALTFFNIPADIKLHWAPVQQERRKDAPIIGAVGVTGNSKPDQALVLLTINITGETKLQVVSSPPGAK